MSTYLEHLRSKHDKHKRRFALGVSAGITAVLALFWATSFSYFNNPYETAEIARRNTENSPLTVIRRNIAGAYESLTGTRVEFVKGQDATTTPVLEYVPEPSSTYPSTLTN